MFGAFNLAMLCGQNYVWGAIGEYILSWFYHGTDPTVKTSQAITVIPITWAALNIMSFVGPRLIQYVNLRVLLAAGSVINLLCTWVAFNLCDSFGWFRFWYAFAACLGSGVVLSATLVIVYEWFEKRQGLGVGIYFCGFTTGAVITQNIAFKIVNPDNINVNSGGFFPANVSDNLPKTINYLFIVYIIFGLIGITFTIRKP